MTFRTLIYTLTNCFILGCNFTSAKDYLKRGYETSKQGNYKEAILIYNKAIDKYPKLKEAYIQKGLCFEYLDQDDTAIKVYEKLLSFDHKNTTAFYYIGLCKYRQNKLQEAIESFNNALITKGISDPSDSTQLILDLNKNGILGDIAVFDVASYEIYYNRGLAYYSLGQIKSAYYDFGNCIKQQYNLGSSYYMVGLCWLTANKKDKACEAFKHGSLYGDSLCIIQIPKVCN